MSEQILKELQDIKALAIIGAKNVLTMSETALLMGVSKDYLYHLVSEKRIPFYKPNKMTYFEKSDIENWLRQNRVTSITEAQEQTQSFIKGIAE